MVELLYEGVIMFKTREIRESRCPEVWCCLKDLSFRKKECSYGLTLNGNIRSLVLILILGR